MEVVVRELMLKDFTGVIGLIRNEMGYDDISSEIYDRIMKIYEHNDYITLVAEHDGTIIGFIGLMHGLAFELQGDYLRIIAMAVKREYQNQKIGLLLVQKAEEYAYSMKVSNIALTSGLNRADSHIFYKSLGYVKKGFCYVKSIHGETVSNQSDMLRPIPKRHFIFDDSDMEGVGSALENNK